jgi:hypothetical protein
MIENCPNSRIAVARSATKSMASAVGTKLSIRLNWTVANGTEATKLRANIMITRNAKRVCREDGGIAAIKNSFAAAWLPSAMG